MRHLQRQAHHAPVSQRSAHARNRLFTRHSLSASTGYPLSVVLKPACSHGGDRVALVSNEREWYQAAAAILPQPALQQAVVDGAGQDLRVYVVHGRIVAAVMRTAAQGVVSNFKRGGSVALRGLTPQERALAQAVIDRFSSAGAPLTLAGVDLMNDRGRPVVNEVETWWAAACCIRPAISTSFRCFWTV